MYHQFGGSKEYIKLPHSISPLILSLSLYLSLSLSISSNITLCSLPFHHNILIGHVILAQWKSMLTKPLKFWVPSRSFIYSIRLLQFFHKRQRLRTLFVSWWQRCSACEVIATHQQILTETSIEISCYKFSHMIFCKCVKYIFWANI